MGKEKSSIVVGTGAAGRASGKKWLQHSALRGVPVAWARRGFQLAVAFVGPKKGKTPTRIESGQAFD